MEGQEVQGSAIVILDPAGTVLHASGVGIHGLPGTPESLKGRRAPEMWSPGGGGVLLKAFVETFLHDAAPFASTILQGRAPDGSERLYRGRLFRVDLDGAVRLVLTLVDITGTSKVAYQLAMLQRVGEVMQGTLELNKVLYLILTCVTAGFAIGFNRAFLLLVDPETRRLQGRMAVGPRSLEEASRIWQELSRTPRGLEEFLLDYEAGRAPKDQPLGLEPQALSFDLSDPSEIPVRVLHERRITVVRQASTDPRVSERFRGAFQAEEFVAVPLLARNEPVGVILADNRFSGRPIADEHVQLLSTFASSASLAVQNAAAYERLQHQMAALQEAQDRLIRSERLATVGKLAAHISHEIRNPLVTIGGFARLILRGAEKTETVREKARIIGEEVSRLETMLSSVMDFAKPAAPKLETADLNPLVSGVVRFVEADLKGRGIRIEEDYARDLPSLRLDPAQVKQVLLNVLQNAADSMAGGGAIRVRTNRAGRRVVAEIRDEGAGITPEDRPMVFEPFFTKKWGGTGLGLAVSRKIMEDHGGGIELESEVGKGTVVRLLFVSPETPPGDDGGRPA